MFPTALGLIASWYSSGPVPEGLSPTERSFGRTILRLAFIFLGSSFILIFPSDTPSSYSISPAPVFRALPMGFTKPSLVVPAGSEVYESLRGITGIVLGFMDPKAHGAIIVGSVIGGDGLQVALPADSVLPRHMLIAGSTGTGKSYLLGIITEQLKGLGVRHINVDVHGELCRATSELGGQNLVPGRTLKVRLSSLEEPEVLNMLPISNELHVDIVSRAFLNLKRTGREFEVNELKREALNVAVSYGVKQNTLDIIDARVETLNQIPIIGPGFSWPQALQQTGALVNLDCRDLGHTELRIVVAAVARELMNLRRKSLLPPLV